MSLWDVLTVGAGATAFGGGLYEANMLKAAGGWKYVVSLILVVTIAAGCVAVMRAVGRKIFTRLLRDDGRESSSDTKEFSGRMVYILALVWCVVSPFIASWLTRQFVDYLR